MIIVYNYKDKKPFTIIGKRKSGGGGGDVEPKPLLKSRIYIGTDGSTNDDIQITIPKEVGSFYGSIGNDYENPTFYPNEEGTVLTTTSSAGYSLFNITKTDTTDKENISFNRKVQVEINLFEDIDDYAFNRLFYQSNNVSKVVITSYNVKIGKSAFENTFYYNNYLTEVIFDLKNSELSEGTFIGTFNSCYNLNKANIGLVKINENCKSTFKETFKDAGNGEYIEGRFDLPKDDNLRVYVPESCFEYCFASPNSNSGFNLLFDIFRYQPNIIKKRGMYSMFYNNKNIKATPFIELLHRVEEQGMSYCFSNTSALDRIQIDFRFLEYVGSEGFSFMFSGNNNTNLHFEVYDNDISNILMNIGNINTVFSEFSCFYMFDRTYINAPNLLYVDYNNPIPTGCFETMFYKSQRLETMSIGSMSFDYDGIRHPFNNTFRYSQRLNKINSKLTNYTSFHDSIWLGGINTDGVLQVPEDANLGNYDYWLPNNWIIVDENGNAIINLPEVGSDEDILYIQNVDEWGDEITLTETYGMLYYSRDGYNWETYVDDTPIYVGKNTLIFFKYNTFDVTIQPYMYNIPFRYHVGGELKGIGQGGMYGSMFSGQTNLIDASKLKLNGADSGRYDCHEMFYECSNLLRGPEIMIDVISSSSFDSIFMGCSSLESLKIHCSVVNTNILYSSSDSGTLYCPLYCSINLPTGWTRVNIDEPSLPEVADNEDILVIENVDTVEGTVLMRNPNNIPIQYSTDGESFNEYTTASEILINPSEKVYFKWSEVIGKYNLFGFDSIVKSSVKYNVYGELKQGNNEYAYYNMFRGESNLIDASQLQLTSTSLNKGCYGTMFYNCRNLTAAPELLPATVLAESCYSAMFQKCTSLTSIPAILPATTLQNSCYSAMFYECSSLTTAPELPATELKTSSYHYMFRYCTSLNYVKHHIVNWNEISATDWLYNVAPSGTVECPANSTIPSDSTSGIPSGWTRVNIE